MGVLLADPLFLGIWDKNEYLKTWKIKKRIPQNVMKIPWNVSGSTSKRSENTLKLPQNYVFIPENLIFLKNTYFSWSSFKFDQKYTGKYHKIVIIPMSKSLFLTSSSEKFSPGGAPLPEDSLSGEQSPTQAWVPPAPCTLFGYRVFAKRVQGFWKAGTGIFRDFRI